MMKQTWQRFLHHAKQTDHIFMVVAAVFIGLVAGFGAVGLRMLIHFFQRIFFGAWPYTLEYVQAIPWYNLMLIPAAGGLLVGPIIHFLAREAKGHGVPEVMMAITLRDGVIRPRVVIAKILASAISIASGGSVGREGPIIQIGSAIGSTFGQIMQVSVRRMRTLVGCGAAAGIAAAFNAPVAGALFAVEIILGDFGVPQFSPIVISSVTATVISRSFEGDFPAFTVPRYILVSPFELVPYLVLGLLAGLAAVTFIKILYFSEDLFEKRLTRIPGWLQPAVGGLLVGAIGIFFPQIFGVGYETISAALYNQLTWQLLTVLILVKLLATCITLGSGGSGGVFAPSLFLGAMTGGAVGHLANALAPTLTAPPGAYALVGMGAVVAAGTHAPITAIIMIFEMTNDYKIILPLMIACIVATLLASYLHKESIYTLKLKRRGIDIHEGKEVNVLRAIPVKKVMSTTAELVKTNTTFEELYRRMSESQHRSFFVVDQENNNLQGIISFDHIRRLLAEYGDVKTFVLAVDLMDPVFPRIRPDDSLDVVMKHFSGRVFDELPVVSPEVETVVVGSIRFQTVMEAYNREIVRRDMAGSLMSSITAAESGRGVELVDGFILTEVEAPREFTGKTLKDIAVRSNYNVEIILIKKRGPAGEVLKVTPQADYQVQDQDTFLIFGEFAEIERFRRI